MSGRNRLRSLSDAQGHVDELAAIAESARPLSVMLEAAGQGTMDERTGKELILLLQCITDMTWRLQLDTDTVTVRFKRWAGRSSRSWWELYEHVMNGDRHATKQMYRES